MIGRIHGTLIDKAPPSVLVDCSGVGYELLVSMNTFYGLPPAGETVTLHTTLIVRDDAHTLYGFATLAERAGFAQLIKVTGIGARMALAILSGMGVDELAQTIADQDAARLIKVPGIGKKTAERLLLELKGKLGSDALPASQATVGGAAHADIEQALMALGYSAREAAKALKDMPADIEVSAGIKQALQALAR